jgi:O-antigen/teichoic acid export membrane protein
LFGKEYIAGANVLRLLALGTVFYTISQINNAMLTGIGKPKIVGKIMIFTAILNLIGNLLLIPKYGMMGATISTVVCFAIIMFSSHIALSRHIKTGTDIKNILLIILNSLIFLGVIYIVTYLFISNTWLAFFFSALFGTIVYLVGLFLFRIITISEIKSLFGRLK